MEFCSIFDVNFFSFFFHVLFLAADSQRDENEFSNSSMDVDLGPSMADKAVVASRPPSVERAESSMTDSTPPAVPLDSLKQYQPQHGKSSTKTKLKLLGVVPIPGTKKTWYKEDRRDKKAEKRIQKQKRRPAWEVGTADGKY